MGNGIGKVCLCSTAAGDISRRHATNLLGDSILYVRPPDPFSDDDVMTTFRSVSGASVSANSSTPPSTTIADSVLHHSGVVLDSSASFTSSMPLQQHAWWSGPIETGFSSGPLLNEKGSPEPSKNLRRSFSHDDHGNKPRRKDQNLKGILTRVISGFIAKGAVWIRGSSKKNAVANVTLCGGLSLQSHDAEDGVIDNDCYLDGGGDLVLMGLESENLQWAQGRAGEDRVHIVISEEQGWVFVGIYDGFNGPDATDYLLDNLFYAVYDELKGLLCGTHNSEPLELEEKVLGLVNGCCTSMENDVLLALSVALRKTEDAFLKSVDDNPVLAMMGSCVLVMLMKGEDVYLMNVGDSRAVLATHSANSLQLTMEHSTCVKEEVQRIMMEHPDDPSAISKGRVKGYLNVTRAFGAGFLKQPKQNNAILETFRVNYIGDSPYITCSPSLHHHRLSLSDRFLILCSDGLHQYFTNEEAVAKVESFIALSPDIDPAQLLIKETLSRAAKRAGIDFHELLEIPQGERRLYHDDISIVIISLEGKIWRSSF